MAYYFVDYHNFLDTYRRYRYLFKFFERIFAVLQLQIRLVFIRLREKWNLLKLQKNWNDFENSFFL